MERAREKGEGGRVGRREGKVEGERSVHLGSYIEGLPFLLPLESLHRLG